MEQGSVCQDSNIFGRYYQVSSRLLSKNTKIRVYRTVVLPVVLYGCETWSLILKEEQRLMVFEDRVLRRIFGPKRDEATGEWRRLHNEELNDLYSSPNIIRVIKSRIMSWAGHVACRGKREVHTVFWWGDLREGDHLGDPGADWRIILKWIFKKWGWGMDWIGLAQDRDRWRALVNAVMNLRIP
jgi:hypothetical protein